MNTQLPLTVEGHLYNCVYVQAWSAQGEAFPPYYPNQINCGCDLILSVMTPPFIIPQEPAKARKLEPEYIEIPDSPVLTPELSFAPTPTFDFSPLSTPSTPNKQTKSSIGPVRRKRGNKSVNSIDFAPVIISPEEAARPAGQRRSPKTKRTCTRAKSQVPMSPIPVTRRLSKQEKIKSRPVPYNKQTTSRPATRAERPAFQPISCTDEVKFQPVMRTEPMVPQPTIQGSHILTCTHPIIPIERPSIPYTLVHAPEPFAYVPESTFLLPGLPTVTSEELLAALADIDATVGYLPPDEFSRLCDEAIASLPAVPAGVFDFDNSSY